MKARYAMYVFDGNANSIWLRTLQLEVIFHCVKYSVNDVKVIGVGD